MTKQEFIDALAALPDDADIRIYHVIGKSEAVHDYVDCLQAGPDELFTIYPAEYSPNAVIGRMGSPRRSLNCHN